MYGILQVVLRDDTLLKGLSREDCVSIKGIMEKRDEETYNPKIPSGTIELEAKEITVSSFRETGWAAFSGSGGTGCFVIKCSRRSSFCE